MSTSSGELPIGPATPCQLACQNGGYCSQKISNGPEIFASGGMLETCMCPPGFSGLTCENIVEQCQDSLKCHNGAPCSFIEGKYVCDCSRADAVSAFAGAMCRRPATSYCGHEDLQNRSFCTNGGLCVENMKATHSM